MLAATITGAASAEETMSHRPSAHQLVRKLPVASPTPVNRSAPIKPQANPNVPGTFKYYGGHVMSNVQVVNVYWGAGGKTAAPADTEDYFKFIVNSPFMDWLGEYDTTGVTVTGGATGTSQHVNRGTFLKGVTITPKTATSTTKVTDDDIGAELSGQITAGNVPAPQVDSQGGVNTLYNIYFPAGLYIEDSQQTPSCNAPDAVIQAAQGAFCGYHGAVAMTVGGTKVSVPYSVLPDMFDTGCACVTQGCGCGGTTSAQSAMITASHELTEAMTDPEIDILIHDPNATAIGAPVAWYDDKNGEIGDICGSYYQQNNDVNGEFAPLPGAPAGKGWIAQNIYSQRLQTCLVQDPSLPLCGATAGTVGDAGAGDAGAAKGGRPCKACSTNADCSATPSTPACETDVTNPKAGTCVACSANADCKVATSPVCEKTATGATAEDTCRGCKADSECAAPTAKCATSGACVACVTDADCTSTQTCDTASNTCKDKPVTGGSGGDGGTGSGSGSGSGGGSGGNGDNGGSGGCAAAPGGSAANGFALGGLVLGLVAFARRRRR